MGGAFFMKIFKKRSKNVRIKTELLKVFISDFINCHIDDILEVDADEIANSVAIKVLGEIQEIIKDDELNDFMKVDEIVCVFEENKIDFGNCHDLHNPLF